MVLLSAGFLMAADAKKDDPKDLLKKLDGNWQVISLEVDGQKTSADETKLFKVTIKNGSYTLKNQDNTVNEGTLKIDASKKPMTIDITPKKGDNAGKVMPGIIEIEGDTQKVCFVGPDKDRPTKFVAESGTTLIVYKKEKP
jgi:uncharacterized protein (TIGR03067 family)